MKLLQVAIFLFGFSTPIAAGGKRTAAELAAGYLVYLQEEVFTDKSRWAMAKDCVGSRSGIRGQKKRCTVAEFVEYLWKQDPHNPDVPKPDPDKVKWPNDMLLESKMIEQNGKLVPQNMLPDNWINWIFTGVRQYDLPSNTPGRSVIPLPAPGFTGVFDANKMVDKVGGVTYYDSLAEVGKVSKVAANEYNKIKGSLGDSEKQFFETAKTQVARAASITYYLRVKDKWDALWDPMKGDVERKLNLGVPIAKSDGKAPADIAESVGPDWREMHTVKTIEALKAKNNWTFAEASKFFYGKWNAIKSSPMWTEHEAAIKGTQRFTKNMGC